MSDEDKLVLCQLNYTNNNCDRVILIKRTTDEIKQLAIMLFLKDQHGWFCKDHHDLKWAMLSDDTQQQYIRMAVLVFHIKDMI